MRILVLGLLGLLVCSARANVDSVEETDTTVEITGHDITPGGPPVETGSTASGPQEEVATRKASSKAVENQLLPTYCPYPDQDFPACGNWNGGTESAVTQEDCLRHCKDTAECDRVLFNPTAQTCKINTRTGTPATPSDCTVDDTASNLQAAAGSTLLNRQVAVGSETAGECPHDPGVPAPSTASLPEDDFVSGHFCKADNQKCDFSGAYRSDFAMSLLECKQECNSQIACATAVFVIPESMITDTRMCHLLVSPCALGDLVDDVEPGDDHWTMFRMTATQYEERKRLLRRAGFKINDPEVKEQDFGCPPGTTYYKDEPDVYTDDYCVLNLNGLCPMDYQRNRMVQDIQNFAKNGFTGVAGCQAKCNRIPTCAGIEFNYAEEAAFREANGIAGKGCMLYDQSICGPDDIVKSTDSSNMGQVQLRLKKPIAPSTEEPSCPAGSVPPPTRTDWKAKFCIVYDRTCSAGDGRNSVPIPDGHEPTDRNSCLVACFVAGNCQTAYFENGACTLLDGSCTDDELQTSLFKRLYVQYDEYTPCPNIECPAHSHPERGSVCPNTCSDPGGSGACDYETYQCVCDDDYLEHQAQCIPAGDCPQEMCKEGAPSSPVLVADDEQAKIYRTTRYSDVDIGIQCAVGAIVKDQVPCANTCSEPDAQSSCVLSDAYPSCHCADPNQVYNGKHCLDVGDCEV